MAQIAQLPLMHWSKVASLETPMSNSDPAVNTKDSKSSPNLESASSKKEPADSKKKYTSSGSNEERSPLLCLDELGEFNTRLFLKGLSPEIHSHVFLYSVFRSYGKIRMLALNSKRHNALVEYEDKAAAATAKKGCKTFRGIDGKVHGIKIFWGKHINRELPLKKNDKPDMQVSVSHKNQEGGTEHMLSLSLPLLPVSLSTKREHLEADTSDSSNNLELEDTGNFWCYEKSIWLPEYSPWLGFRNLNSSSFRNLFALRRPLIMVDFDVGKLPSGTAGVAKAGVTWDSLRPALLPVILSVLKEKLGYRNMTPVQAATLPPFLQYKDVAVQAPTGSGKTIAFVVPMLEKLLRLENPLGKMEVGAIVVTPTRELAFQIYQVIQQFTSEIEVCHLSTLLLIGGTNTSEDLARIREHGAHIIVATPGRLEDTIGRVCELKLNKLEVLILDEADRLLDSGFHMDTIISALPKQRRTGLFSATLTQRLDRIIETGMRNPLIINVRLESADASKSLISVPKALENFVVRMECDVKFSFLVHLLKTQLVESKTIVFFSTIASVIYFWKVLLALKLLPPSFQIFAFHGQVSQIRRIGIYQRFFAAKKAVLLTTDVAARGLDFECTDCVIQFDPPKDSGFYIHRIGRTARIGNSGKAILFLLPNEEAYVDLIAHKGIRLSDMAGFENMIIDWDSHLVCDSLRNMSNLVPLVRNLSMSSREFLEKGTLAFISHIRSYKENRSKYIFKLKELNIARVADLFGLLKLPRMSEFSKQDVAGFKETEVDLSTIGYLDEKREALRQQKLRVVREGKPAPKKTLESREEVAKPCRESDSDDEDIDRDYCLLKKLKRGKITQCTYEKLTGERDLEERLNSKRAPPSRE